ncbi:MAG TPA: hypothetical protein VJT73_08670 [Polyangiaceae bacterium]|nr:hypothetical protein [Polyangiaceae bacterium]
MYETFGFGKRDDGRYTLRLFLPDTRRDPNQFGRGGPHRVVDVRVVGDFQAKVGHGPDWSSQSGLVMAKVDHPSGAVFEYVFPEAFPDGYYQYKYLVRFENGSVRWVGDPCTKYGGDSQDNSAFVVGGAPVEVTPLPAVHRRRHQDLVIYELMIDDFTAGYRQGRSPIEAVADKLDDLVALGVNAIEFMPWTAWPDSDDFSWGYDPAYFFSVESDLVRSTELPGGAPSRSLDKLSRLATMVSECHRRGLMVIVDIVLQHASPGVDTKGFPYYWLWQDAADCPFVGNFTNAETFGSLPLDYGNRCTLEFVADVCKYWVSRFEVDGFRFDQISGYRNPDFPAKGAPALIEALRTWLDAKGLGPFPLIVEDTFDYDVIRDTNALGATGGWFDMFRSRPFQALAFGQRLGPEFVRVLNAARDFAYPIGPTVYIENHDHTTITARAGGRGPSEWPRTQPYAIALATCAGALLLHNGQEFGQVEVFPEPGEPEPPGRGRVRPRPLRWEEWADPVGRRMRELYAFLLQLRARYAGLRSPNFYPNEYDWQRTHFDGGYGIDVDMQVVIYHRWGTGDAGRLERFMVVLNFSQETRWVTVPFPTDGRWVDLLNGSSEHLVAGYQLTNHPVGSNWGGVFFQGE